MNSPGPILEAKDLQVAKGGTLVLDVPNLAVDEGEILSLIGPNGAGKTTLLQTLARLVKLSRGKIFFRSQEVSSNHSEFIYRRRLAMVFQDPLLFDTTVFENVASGLKIRGINKQTIQRMVAENLERFGIAHLLHRSARKISGGEVQRVALARAFAPQPELLFLDEPFASLDPPTRESLLEDLESVLRQTKTTTLLATHDRMEALRLSDRIALMNTGRILQVGSPGEVMNQPRDEFVASFVGVETILTGKVSKKDKGSFLASIMGSEMEAVGEVELGETVVFCIRPENVTLSPPFPKRATSARNVFTGKIEKVIPMGLFYKVQLDCGFPLVAHVTSHALEDLELKEGKEIFASFKATSIHVVRKKLI
ncbi:MAG: ABC transporter ATP-binding protein [Pseudomonadota bacterium]